MSCLVEQLPHCDLLRLSLLTGWFVLSARQVVFGMFKKFLVLWGQLKAFWPLVSCRFENSQQGQLRRLRPKSLDARMYLSNGWGGDCCLGRTAESAPTYVPKTEGSRTAETAPLDESRGEEGWADCYPSWDQCQRGHLRMLVKFLMLGQNVANLWGCGFFFKTFFLSPPAACCSRGEPMPVERRNIV